MSGVAAERQSFIRAYTRILVSSWFDSSYLARLTSSPREILAQEGLEVPDAVEVRIQHAAIPIWETESSDAALNAQVDLWLAAREAGEFVLYLPEAPENRGK